MTEVVDFFDHLFIRVDYKTPDKHKHLAKHMIYSLNEKMECLIEGKKVLCDGIWIDSNVEHTIKSDEQSIVVFLFEETSFLGCEVKKKYLKSGKFSIMNKELITQLREITWQHRKDLQEIDKEILLKCGLKRANLVEYDKRIRCVLDMIRDKEEIERTTLQELCTYVNLSQSRLSHLFKDQVGISLQSYLVLEKMRKAYTYALYSQNVTQAAIQAGFDSSSHFAATCKKMFGLSFTDFTKTLKK